MAQAFVLINTENKAEDEVLKALSEIPGIKETYMIHGVYKLLARIEEKTGDKLRDIVIKVRSIENVRSTLTMVCIRAVAPSHARLKPRAQAD